MGYAGNSAAVPTHRSRLGLTAGTLGYGGRHLDEQDIFTDRVKAVVVGLNFGGHILKRILDGPGRRHIELLGVCDLDARKLNETALSLGVRAYPSLDDVLADPTVEAVCLFTGPAGRENLVRKCIRAGKHVLTTKPFARDAEAALDVLREADRLGKVVAMNSPSPTLPPDLAWVQARRQEFDLGRPIGARFDVWASYQESFDGRWHDDPALCPVAPVFRIGIYLINDAVRLFGEADEVSVLASRIRTGRPTPDNALLGIRFQSGALANIFASFCVDDGDAHRNQMTLNFERGTIYRNCGPVQSAYRDGGSEMALVRRGPDGREVVSQAVLSGYHPQMAYQWDVFHRLVRGERPPSMVTPEIIVAGIRIIEAMARAEAGGGQAAVEPVTFSPSELGRAAA